ncbi:sigma-70 family RNA polymerase sigma factor [Spirochaetota bacterium]
MKNINFDKCFIACYIKYYKRINNYIKRFVQSSDISEELAQDVFLKYYENKYKLDPDLPSTKNYLCTMARNCAIDYIRRKKNEKTKYEQIQYEEITLNKQFYNELENSYIAGEIYSKINDTINSFPQLKKNIIIDKFIYNKSRNDISKEKNVTQYMIKKIELEVQELIEENLFTNDSDYEN